MCFLVEKYVPSSKKERTVGDGGGETPKLSPSEEGNLAIPEVTERVQSLVLEAATTASQELPRDQSLAA